MHTFRVGCTLLGGLCTPLWGCLTVDNKMKVESNSAEKTVLVYIFDFWKDALVPWKEHMTRSVHTFTQLI